MKKILLIFILILPFLAQSQIEKAFQNIRVDSVKALDGERLTIGKAGDTTNIVGILLNNDAEIEGGEVDTVNTIATKYDLTTVTGSVSDYDPANFLLNSFVSALNYPSAQRKIIPFAEKYTQKSGDVEIMLLGDSHTARTYNNTAYSSSIQKQRPPSLISENIASQLWDKIKWTNQYYIRFDSSGIFTETGTTWTSYTAEDHAKNLWDDDADRSAQTREGIGTDELTLEFSFFADYNRMNLIYRTSTEGSDTINVTVSGGNGKIQYWTGTTWSELNGLMFSMLYSGSGDGYGNTEYGRRLKMRKVNSFTDQAYDITLTKPATVASESIMYWGIEYSQRNYMLILRNASRAGHDLDDLGEYILTETENFETDLILFQIPYLNMQASDGSGLTPATMWTDGDFGLSAFLLDSTNSLYNISNKWQDFQVLAFTTHERQAWYDTDGEEIGQTRKLGGYPYFFSSDFFDQFQYRFMQLDSVGFINVNKPFNKAGIALFGNMYDALTYSGAASTASFAEDNPGVHPNDYGCKAIVNFLSPAFDFIDNIKPVLADSAPEPIVPVYANRGYIASKAEITIPELDTVNVTTTFGVTWGGWFRHGSSSDNYALIRKPIQAAQDYITFRAYTSGGSQGNLRAQFYNWNGSSHTGKTVTKTGVSGVYDSTWVHIVGQIDIVADSLRLFVNGVWAGSLKMSISTLYPDNSLDWVIRYPDVDRFGDFDELFITREMLTFDQIDELYGGGINNPGILDELTGITTGLIRAYYRFEEGTGATASGYGDAGDLTIGVNQTWKTHE